MDHRDRIRQNLEVLGLDSLRDISLADLFDRVDDSFPEGVSKKRILSVFISWLYDRLTVIDNSEQNAAHNEIGVWCDLLRSCSYGNLTIADAFKEWEEEHVKMEPFSARRLTLAWIDLQDILGLPEGYTYTKVESLEGIDFDPYVPRSSVKSTSGSPVPDEKPYIASREIKAADSHWGYIHPDRLVLSRTETNLEDDDGPDAKFNPNPTSPPNREEKEDLSFLTGANLVAYQASLSAPSERRPEIPEGSKRKSESHEVVKCKRCLIQGHVISKCPTNIDPAYDMAPKEDYQCSWCGKYGDHYSGFCKKNIDPSSIHQKRVRAGIYDSGCSGSAYGRAGNLPRRELRLDDRSRHRDGDSDEHPRRPPFDGVLPPNPRIRRHRERGGRGSRLERNKSDRRSSSPFEDRIDTYRSSREEREREREKAWEWKLERVRASDREGDRNRDRDYDRYRDRDRNRNRHTRSKSPPRSRNCEYNVKEMDEKSREKHEGRLSFQDFYEGDDEIALPDCSTKDNKDILHLHDLSEEEFRISLDNMIAEVESSALQLDNELATESADATVNTVATRGTTSEALWLDSMNAMSLHDSSPPERPRSPTIEFGVSVKELNHDTTDPTLLELFQGRRNVWIHKSQRIRGKDLWNAKPGAPVLGEGGPMTQHSEITNRDVALEVDERQPRDVARVKEEPFSSQDVVIMPEDVTAHPSGALENHSPVSETDSKPVEGVDLPKETPVSHDDLESIMAEDGVTQLVGTQEDQDQVFSANSKPIEEPGLVTEAPASHEDLDSIMTETETNIQIGVVNQCLDTNTGVEAGIMQSSESNTIIEDDTAQLADNTDTGPAIDSRLAPDEGQEPGVDNSFTEQGDSIMEDIMLSELDNIDKPGAGFGEDDSFTEQGDSMMEDVEPEQQAKTDEAVGEIGCVKSVAGQGDSPMTAADLECSQLDSIKQAEDDKVIDTVMGDAETDEPLGGQDLP